MYGTVLFVGTLGGILIGSQEPSSVSTVPSVDRSWVLGSLAGQEAAPPR